MEEKSILAPCHPEFIEGDTIRGFITHKELSEARTYIKLPTPTMWQKKQVVKLYIQLITGVKFSGRFEETDGLEKFYLKAKEHFQHESSI